MAYKRADFPENFLFGTATSAYQIEGHGFGGTGPTHWDDFAATPGNVVRAEDGRVACDHYHHYEEDLNLAAAAGFDAYRFSTSWARVLPQGRGTVNPDGLDFYDRLVDAMLERGLKPFATLYHWELPSALSDLGGWRNRDIASWFGDFTRVVMKRIGDRVHATTPINEPWCVAWLSHYLGLHAPGVRDIRAAARAMHHVLLAHGTAIGVMRELGLSNLGIVANLEYANPANDTDAARNAARTYDAIYNRFFLEGVFRKVYPDEIVAGLGAHLPDGWQDDFEIIAQSLDWVGLNYYTRKNLAPGPSGLFGDVAEVEGPLPKTTMGWEIFPEGLYHFLTRVHELCGPDMPIFITENGMSANDVVVDGHVHDEERIDFLDSHFAEIRRALDAGIPITGFFVWSLLDNYEWASGYEKRFGLVHVDFETLKRTPKDSFLALKAALKS